MIILLGDNLQDIKMIKPEERASTLAVGFCHADTREAIGAYSQIFDIVVVSNTSDNGVLEYIQKRIKPAN